MKRIVSVLIVIVLFVTSMSSCQKSTYPRDPYRGSGSNPYYYQNNNRLKSKNHRTYRQIKGAPFKKNVGKLPKGRSTVR